LAKDSIAGKAALQGNMRAGAMPPPEDNGTVYLKLPIDWL
jgi:hypothetical protein